MADATKNFAFSLVATAPSPAASGTSLVVTAGDGAKFPAAPFYAVCWPAGTQPSSTNAEVIRVTAVSTDTFTITRAQDGSTAQSIAVGWNVDNNIVAGLLGQFMATSVYDPAGIAQQVVGTTATQTLANKTLTSPSVNELTVSGLTGASAASRYVGATTSGAPTTGTFAVGDFVIDQTGFVWVCTTAGTPGTWTKVGGGGALSYVESYIATTVVISTVAATPIDITSVSLGAGTWLITGRARTINGSTAGQNFVDLWLGPTSASITNAYADSSSCLAEAGNSAYAYESEVVVTKVVVLGATTTVYLTCETSTTGAIVGRGYADSSLGNISGITAVKIG